MTVKFDLLILVFCESIILLRPKTIEWRIQGDVIGMIYHIQHIVLTWFLLVIVCLDY